MKFLSCFFASLMAALIMVGSAAASSARPLAIASKADRPTMAPATTRTRHLPSNNQAARRQPAPQKFARSRRKKGLSLAVIRSGAIRETIRDLEELRPYAKNFRLLKKAVRRYWNRNITRPSTRGLAGTIMRHVKSFYKDLVRDEVYSSTRSGIKKVKKALRKRRR